MSFFLLPSTRERCIFCGLFDLTSSQSHWKSRSDSGFSIYKIPAPLLPFKKRKHPIWQKCSSAFFQKKHFSKAQSLSFSASSSPFFHSKTLHLSPVFFTCILQSIPHFLPSFFSIFVSRAARIQSRRETETEQKTRLSHHSFRLLFRRKHRVSRGGCSMCRKGKNRVVFEGEARGNLRNLDDFGVVIEYRL